MHFPDFYMKQKSRIITLHACIILAIIGRMIMSEIYAMDNFYDAYNRSINDNTWYAPLIQILSNIFSTLLPIAALLYSLLHAIA